MVVGHSIEDYIGQLEEAVDEVAVDVPLQPPNMQSSPVGLVEEVEDLEAKGAAVGCN